jgi:hypothetical protein
MVDPSSFGINGYHIFCDIWSIFSFAFKYVSINFDWKILSNFMKFRCEMIKVWSKKGVAIKIDHGLEVAWNQRQDLNDIYFKIYEHWVLETDLQFFERVGNGRASFYNVKDLKWIKGKVSERSNEKKWFKILILTEPKGKTMLSGNWSWRLFMERKGETLHTFNE